MPAPCAGVLRDDNDHEDEDDKDDKEVEGALAVAVAVVAEDEREEEEDAAAGVACIEGLRPGIMCFASRFRRVSSSLAFSSDRYGSIRKPSSSLGSGLLSFVVASISQSFLCSLLMAPSIRKSAE